MLTPLFHKSSKRILLLVLLSLCIYSCFDKKYCKDGFDFTAEEYNSIPYLKNKFLIFQNKEGQKDTFIITGVRKGINDYNDPIETGAHHNLEIEIRYTNKHFREAINTDRFLFNIQKECISKEISYYSYWMDFAGSISFNRGYGPERCTHRTKIDSLKIRDHVIRSIIKFETDTIKCPEEKDRDIQTVYWQPDRGVVMYNSIKSGLWKRIN